MCGKLQELLFRALGSVWSAADRPPTRLHDVSPAEAKPALRPEAQRPGHRTTPQLGGNRPQRTTGHARGQDELDSSTNRRRSLRVAAVPRRRAGGEPGCESTSAALERSAQGTEWCDGGTATPMSTDMLALHYQSLI